MSSEALRLAVERSLRVAWGGDVVLEQSDEEGLSGRHHVHRFRVQGAPTGTPASVVVKQPRLQDGEAFDAHSDGPAVTMFFNEWVCLQLLTELCAEPPAPRLYYGSANEGFLVMEDFGSADRLDHALLGHDAGRATQTLIALFETVGQMHATTVGQRTRFDAILAEHGRKRPQLEDGMHVRRQTAIQNALSRLALRPHPTFFDETAQIGERVNSPEVETLLHGDPCPDNCQWVGNRVRLLDFEHGRFGNAFSDGCYPVIHFPTCWCIGRLPDDVVLSAVEAYRRALAPGVRIAVDDQQFARGMLDASILWAWSTFASWFMPDVLSRDHEWGLATVRQRILFRFRLVTEMLERHRHYPGIADTTRRSYDLLSGRWSEVAEMPLYPAFR